MTGSAICGVNAGPGYRFAHPGYRSSNIKLSDTHHALSVRRKAARVNFATPGARLSIDAVEVVTAASMMLARDLGSRGHAGDRDRAMRPSDIGQRMGVIVSVDDKLGTMLSKHRAKLTAVHKTLEIAPRSAARGMMDEDDTKQSLPAAAFE